MLTEHSTLAQFLIEERRRHPDASGELNSLILDVALACKAISKRIAHGSAQRRDRCGRLAQRAGRAAAEARRRRQRHLPADQRVGRAGLAGMVSEELDEPYSIPRRAARAASTCSASTRSTARPTSTSTSRSAASSRSCARRSPGQRRPDRGLPAARAPSRSRAGYAIYGPATMLVLTRRHGRARLHARSGPRRVHPDPPGHRDPASHRGVRHQHLQQPLLGAGGHALRRRVPGRASAGRAARTSTCAGSPPWSPRRTAS